MVKPILFSLFFFIFHLTYNKVFVQLQLHRSHRHAERIAIETEHVIILPTRSLCRVIWFASWLCYQRLLYLYIRVPTAECVRPCTTLAPANETNQILWATIRLDFLIDFRRWHIKFAAWILCWTFVFILFDIFIYLILWPTRMNECIWNDAKMDANNIQIEYWKIMDIEPICLCREWRKTAAMLAMLFHLYCGHFFCKQVAHNVKGTLARMWAKRRHFGSIKS